MMVYSAAHIETSWIQALAFSNQVLCAGFCPVVPVLLMMGREDAIPGVIVAGLCHSSHRLHLWLYHLLYLVLWLSSSLLCVLLLHRLWKMMVALMSIIGK